MKKLQSEKDSFLRNFLRRIQKITVVNGFQDLSKFRKTLEFIARITHLHFMNRLLLSRFVPRFPTYYLGYRYRGFCKM